jgi:excisionase family DNA binding protein
VKTQDEILTIPQAAEHCSVTRMTMWRWVKSGLLRASVTPGGHHRVLKEDLEAFLIQSGMSPLASKHFPRNKVLIVDDDPYIQKALRKLLTSFQYETEIAGSGFEAGIKVTQFKPDLVILDLIMPEMDGFEVCRVLKMDPGTSGIKILALTGHGTAENCERIMEAGADDLLMKPVDPETLIPRIEKLLGTLSA